MKSPPAAWLGCLALSLLFAGCNHPRSSLPSARTHAAPDVFARQQDRQNYVEANYDRLLKSRGFKNESEARAYAGYEWSRLNPNPAHNATQTENVIWSSNDAARQKQEKFEADLAKMKRQ